MSAPDAADIVSCVLGKHKAIMRNLSCWLPNVSEGHVPRKLKKRAKKDGRWFTERWRVLIKAGPIHISTRALMEGDWP